MTLPMSGSIAYLNGCYLSQAELVFPFHDAGFALGATVTDLCRTFGHRLFRLNDHLARFRRSCELARVPQPVPDEQLAQIALKVVAENAALVTPEQDLALVMLATPGSIGYLSGQPSEAGDAGPTLAMHTFPLPYSRDRRLFEEGARLIVPSVQHVPAACVDPRIKQRSRLHWWLAEREVKESDPHAIALLRDAESRITETAAANFLLVRQGAVCTPPRESVLNGISLQVTEELCKKLNIHFEERPLTLDDCLAADEAMLSNTAYCLAGVSRINAHPLRWPGPVFDALLSAWNGLVGLDIRGQICLRR